MCVFGGKQFGKKKKWLGPAVAHLAGHSTASCKKITILSWVEAEISQKNTQRSGLLGAWKCPIHVVLYSTSWHATMHGQTMTVEICKANPDILCHTQQLVPSHQKLIPKLRSENPSVTTGLAHWSFCNEPAGSLQVTFVQSYWTVNECCITQ